MSSKKIKNTKELLEHIKNSFPKITVKKISYLAKILASRFLFVSFMIGFVKLGFSFFNVFIDIPLTVYVTIYASVEFFQKFLNINLTKILSGDFFSDFSDELLKKYIIYLVLANMATIFGVKIAKYAYEKNE